MIIKINLTEFQFIRENEKTGREIRESIKSKINYGRVSPRGKKKKRLTETERKNMDESWS